MAFEYDGKIYLNLEEQVEVNSRMAVDAKETAEAATEAVANKMDKVPSTFTGGIPTINMDGSLTNSNRSFTVRYGTAQHGGQTVYTNALIPTEKATVDFLNDNFTKKQTTTSTAKRAYAYDNTGDINVVISADNANGGTIVQRTGAGRIVCNDPNASGQAATKNYVDTNFAPKAENGYVKKQTTTSGSWRAYVYNNSGDNSLLVISGGDGTVAPTATGNIVSTTSGRIRTNTPTGPYHAANKQYVDDLISSAVVDFNGSNIDTPTTEVGLKVYAAMQTFGFFVPKHTGDGTIFARPLTDSEVTIPANTFAFSAIQATTSGLTDSYSSGLYYTVDSTGVITAVV